MAAFETQELKLALWRAVEAQHRISTMALVDTLEEQALLEQVLEESKPGAKIAAASQLHYLLFTPFRYPPLPNGSRFRAASDAGVFYGADEQRTACAELGYWRWRLLRDSPEMPAIPPVPQTLFRSAVAAPGIDLREPPWARRRKQWTAPDDYASCQKLAGQAREAGVAIIRYQSVRDPQAGGCAAVLSPACFARPLPTESQGWTLAVFQHRVVWRRDSIFEDQSFEFETAIWE